MDRAKQNAEREERIENEIVVDAYDEEERIMGWYYYLDDKIKFPFKAKIIKEVQNSPLKKDENITVTEMSDAEICVKFHSMYVEIQWEKREFSVPLEQLSLIESEYGPEYENETVEAIEDWQYWVDMGYYF